MALVPKVPVSMHETFCETLLRAYYELLVVIAIRAAAAVAVIRDKFGVLADRIANVVAYVPEAPRLRWH